MPVKITKEDELLLEKYSQAASKKSSNLIYGNAILISVIPIWLFSRVHDLPLISNAILYAIISVCSAFLMGYAYNSSKAPLMERVASRRSDAITREISGQSAKDKKISKKERDDAVRDRTREVADYESTTYSIFYNNCVFLLILLVVSMVLQRFSGQALAILNDAIWLSERKQPSCIFCVIQTCYFISMVLASGLTAFLSTGKGSL